MPVDKMETKRELEDMGGTASLQEDLVATPIGFEPTLASQEFGASSKNLTSLRTEGIGTGVRDFSVSSYGCEPRGIDHPSAAFVFGPNAFWQNVLVGKPEECWPWQGYASPQGYGYTAWNHKQRLAHRVMWEALHGAIPQGLLIMHSCDNPPCVNPYHLSLGTNADNHADRNAKGRHAYGERQGQAKLTDAKVREARLLHAGGENYHALGRRYGVDHKAIMRAVLGQTWKHVQ